MTKYLFTSNIAIWNLRNNLKIWVFSSCVVSSLIDEFMNHKSDRLTVLKSKFPCLPMPDVVANSVFTYLSTCSRDGPSTYALISKRLSLFSSLFCSKYHEDYPPGCQVWQRSVSCVCILGSKLWSTLTINFMAIKSGADISLVSETRKWVCSGENYSLQLVYRGKISLCMNQQCYPQPCIIPDLKKKF